MPLGASPETRPSQQSSPRVSFMTTRTRFALSTQRFELRSNLGKTEEAPWTRARARVPTILKMKIELNLIRDTRIEDAENEKKSNARAYRRTCGAASAMTSRPPRCKRGSSCTTQAQAFLMSQGPRLWRPSLLWLLLVAPRRAASKGWLLFSCLCS